MKTLIYIFALFISLCPVAQAQLGMSANYTITPSTALSPTLGVPYDSVVRITCRVINKGTTTFTTGALALHRAVKSGSITSSVRVIYSTSTAATITPGDSITISVTDSILPPAYKINGNGNTIVVWPISSFGVHDSLKAGPVYVSYDTGIEELDRNKLFIYPNPSNHMLFIRPEAGKRYKELIIYDMQLKELTRKPFEESTDIGALPPGTYIISVSDDKGRIYSSRFVKNN